MWVTFEIMNPNIKSSKVFLINVYGICDDDVG
jgi:hypothetical protein